MYIEINKSIQAVTYTINQSLFPYDTLSVFSYTMTYGYRTLHTHKKKKLNIGTSLYSQKL